MLNLYSYLLNLGCLIVNLIKNISQHLNINLIQNTRIKIIYKLQLHPIFQEFKYLNKNPFHIFLMINLKPLDIALLVKRKKLPLASSS